ncbi:MAG TPA: hypothetical protein VG937_32715 [Polyangiaceae bacterium]|nr:hypothetical protein [Polyangiaceae bacterium]
MRFFETPRARELGAWLAALLLHALTLGLVRGTVGDGTQRDAPVRATPNATSSEEFDIQLGTDESAANDPGDARSAQVEPVGPSERAALPAQRVARAVPREPSPGAPAETSALESPESSDATLLPEAKPGDAQTATPEAPVRPNQPIDLGIGADAWQKWTRVERSEREDSGEAPKASKKPLVRAPVPSKTGGLQEGLEAGDRARGLGPSGRVATVFFQATHSDVAPQLGVAHFSVTVLRSGVVEVALTGANRESEKWRAVAARAALALRKSPPRIPPSRDGVRLTLDVTAEETYPNGAKPTAMHGPRLEVTPPVFQPGEAAQAELEDLNPIAATSKDPTQRPPAIVSLPGVYVSGKGKVCSYRIGISALGPLLTGGCDPSNIGAKPQRMVRVAVQDQSFF